MNITEYAAHRGVSRQAVYDAIEEGRITRLSDGGIDVEKSDLDWFQNTDANMQRGGQASPVPVPADEKRKITLNDVKLQREAIKLQHEKLDLEQRIGNLVLKDVALSKVRQIAQRDRDFMTGIGNRYGQQAASKAGIEPHKMMIILDEIGRQAADEMADQALEI